MQVNNLIIVLPVLLPLFGFAYGGKQDTHTLLYNLYLYSRQIMHALTKLEFSVTPTMQVKSVGENAVFRCRHANASIIRWRRDGELIGRDLPPDITPGTERDVNNLLVQTLTIVAGPQYDGTEIVCIAKFDDGTPDEMTSPVILQGMMKCKV